MWGGMPYASLDYYYAHIPIPDYKESYFSFPDFDPQGVPSDSNPLSSYIYARLINSFETPKRNKIYHLILGFRSFGMICKRCYTMDKGR